METKSKSTIESNALEIIQELNQKTSQHWLMTHVGNTMLILFEVTCYLFFVGLLLFAVFMPSGEIINSLKLSESVNVKLNVQIEEMVTLFRIIKALIVVLSLLTLIPAILFRKLRKKNKQLRDINTITAHFIKRHMGNPL